MKVHRFRNVPDEYAKDTEKHCAKVEGTHCLLCDGYYLSIVLLGALLSFSVDFFLYDFHWSMRWTMCVSLIPCDFSLPQTHHHSLLLYECLTNIPLQRKWVANGRERVGERCWLDSCKGKGKRELCIWRGMSERIQSPISMTIPSHHTLETVCNNQSNSISSTPLPRPKMETKRRWHKSSETIPKEDQRPSPLKRPWKTKRPRDQEMQTQDFAIQIHRHKMQPVHSHLHTLLHTIRRECTGCILCLCIWMANNKTPLYDADTFNWKTKRRKRNAV